MTLLQKFRYWLDLSPRRGWRRTMHLGRRFPGWDLLRYDKTIAMRIVRLNGVWELIVPEDGSRAFVAFGDYEEAMIYAEVLVDRMEYERFVRSFWVDADASDDSCVRTAYDLRAKLDGRFWDDTDSRDDEWLQFVKTL
jgi:hypothetical protein